MRTITAGTIVDITSKITARQTIVVKPHEPIVVNLPDGKQSRIESIQFSYLHNGDPREPWVWNPWLTRITFESGVFNQTKSLTGAGVKPAELQYLADSARPTAVPALV